MITDEFTITFNSEYHRTLDQEFDFLDLQDTNGIEYKFYKKVDEKAWLFNEPETNKYFNVYDRYIIKEYPNGLLSSLEIRKVQK